MGTSRSPPADSQLLGSPGPLSGLVRAGSCRDEVSLRGASSDDPTQRAARPPAIQSPALSAHLLSLSWLSVRPGINVLSSWAVIAAESLSAVFTGPGPVPDLS